MEKKAKRSLEATNESRTTQKRARQIGVTSKQPPPTAPKKAHIFSDSEDDLCLEPPVVKQSAPLVSSETPPVAKPTAAAEVPSFKESQLSVQVTYADADMNNNRHRRPAAAESLKRTSEIFRSSDESQSDDEYSEYNSSEEADESEDSTSESTDRPSLEELSSGQSLFYKGFKYNSVVKKSNDGSPNLLYWSCTRRRWSKCPAAFKCYSDGNGFVDYEPNHNHSADKKLKDGSDDNPGTKYGLPEDVFNALDKKQQAGIRGSFSPLAHHDGNKPGTKLYKFVPPVVRRGNIGQQPITALTAHLRCTACGCCLMHNQKVSHVASCILSVHKDLSLAFDGAVGSPKGTILIELCTCCETVGREVDNSLRCPVIVEAMHNPTFAESLLKDAVFLSFQQTVSDFRRPTSGRATVPQVVYVIIETDLALDALSFANMVNAIFYIGEATSTLDRAIRHLTKSSTASLSSTKSEAFIAHRIVEGLRSNGRKRIFIVSLTTGADNGHDFSGSGNYVEALTMLIIGMRTLVNTKFTTTKSFDQRIKPFFKHAGVVITALLYATWTEVFASKQLGHPHVFELTNPDTIRKALPAGFDRSSMRRFKEAIRTLSSRDVFYRQRSIQSSSNIAAQNSSLPILHSDVQRIMNFTVANEDEFRAVIDGKDQFFDAACVTRFLCIASLASGKKAVVVRSSFTSALLNKLEEPDNNSLTESSFNSIDDASIILIPFSTSRNDNGNRVAHWTLFIADRERNALIVYDPLGSTTPCDRQFTIVESIIRNTFYGGDGLNSLCDELTTINCSNLKQNKQPDGTSCGVYVSELAAHYLFTSGFHYLPVANHVELRKHAISLLNDLVTASSTSTSLHFTPLSQWLDELGPSTDKPSPGSSRDSGIFIDNIVHEALDDTNVKFDVLGRIGQKIRDCRRRIIPKTNKIADKKDAMQPHHPKWRYPSWQNSQLEMISRYEAELAVLKKQLADLETTRIILWALWDFYAIHPNNERFLRLKSIDTHKPIQLIASFWPSVPTKEKIQVHCKLARHASSTFDQEQEKLKAWLNAFDTSDAIDLFFATYLHDSA